MWKTGKRQKGKKKEKKNKTKQNKKQKKKLTQLEQIWRTRITCFKDNHILGQNVCPYLHLQHEQIISLPFHEDRHNYCLSRIDSSYDSSSYTHTTMFWLLPFIFWHRLIISAMKVPYYQTVGEVASLPSFEHSSQGKIDFCGHFRVRDVTFFYLLT